MKITLSVKDRLILPNLLPKQGSMIDLEVISNIKENIRFTPKEIEQLKFKDLPNGGVTWNPKEDKPFDAIFENSEIKLMKQGIKQLDESRQITANQYDLCKRINEIKL